MNFIQTNALLDEIIVFLLSCGGVYNETSTELETTILDCISHNQYLLKRNEQGEIIHVMFYWLITGEDAENIPRGIRPQEIHNGNVMYVVEHGGKAGTASVFEMTRKIKNIMKSKGIKLATWNHKQQEFKTYSKVSEA